MKNPKFLYVVNTPNENHFFHNSKEARSEFAEGKSAMKHLGGGEINLFKLPYPGEDMDEQQYYHYNLDTINCDLLLSASI